MTDKVDRSRDAEIEIRDYVHAQDLAEVKRIWQEVGWVEDEHEINQLDHFFQAGATKVATINGSVECSVNVVPGTMRLHETDLSMAAVTAVTTGRVARGYSFAQKVTALQLQAAAERGAAMAALGMFDQGFYDKLGFGTGAYEHEVTFDPGLLRVSASAAPPPVRLSHDDSDAMHDALCARMKSHGSVCLLDKMNFKGELGFTEAAFGFGYRDQSGAITHFIWLDPKAEHGPYRVLFYAYQTREQLMELMSLIKSLADQVYSIKMIEPAQLQLQALLSRPMRQMGLTEGSVHKNMIRSLAWWQARVIDVGQAVAAVKVAKPVRFQLSVSDPITDHIPEGIGTDGDYIVNLNDNPQAERGLDDSLPRLECDVGALTRLLFGVAPATNLALTDQLKAPDELLRELNEAIALPQPNTGWDF